MSDKRKAILRMGPSEMVEELQRLWAVEDAAERLLAAEDDRAMQGIRRIELRAALDSGK